MYLDDGEFFNADGDKVDGRNDIIKQLRREVTGYRMRETRERLLREMNPGLQEAYEQYQTILGLVDNA